MGNNLGCDRLDIVDLGLLGVFQRFALHSDAGERAIVADHERGLVVAFQELEISTDRKGSATKSR